MHLNLMIDVFIDWKGQWQISSDGWSTSCVFKLVKERPVIMAMINLRKPVFPHTEKEMMASEICETS